MKTIENIECVSSVSIRKSEWKLKSNKYMNKSMNDQGKKICVNIYYINKREESKRRKK